MSRNERISVMGTTTNVPAPSPASSEASPFRFFFKLRLIAAITIGYCVAGAIIYQAIEQTKVNGPLYREVVNQKDIIADILPPPSCIIESYLKIFELSCPRHRRELDLFEQDLKKQEAEFEKRLAHWEKELESGVESRRPNQPPFARL